MPLKSPTFWNKTDSIVAKSLLPVAAIYQLGYRLRRHFIQPVCITPKLLCIGNLVAGGAGKTPVALAIGNYVKAHGINACFLSKGYGGKIDIPTQVNSSRHMAGDVGDEPLLLSRILPTIVAKNRAEGARYAEHHGFELIIMDDGFQNPTLKPDLSLIVTDAAYGFGNGYTLPSGPLREPVAYGLARANALIVLNRASAQENTIRNGLIPIITGDLRTTCPLAVANQKAVAFSGIARPQQFFDALVQHCGLQLVASHAFADHHIFSAAEWDFLSNEAKKHNAQLVTTAKDAIRLPQELRNEVLVAEAEINWHNADALAEILSPLLSPKES